ncbi:pancreatic adenocarcinoma up-regulated factor [Hipposideros larvatus]
MGLASAVGLTFPGTVERNTNTEQPATLQDTPEGALAKGGAFKALLAVEITGQRLAINERAEGLRPHIAEMQGPGGGSYFYVTGEEQGEIQGVRIFMGMMGLIKGIQLRFGEHWSPRYGAPGGRAQEFLLWSGERITAVSGSARACIRHLSWSTSRGRQATFGRPTGRRFSAHPPAAGQQLLSTNGQHGLFCLSGIGFKWGSAPEKPSAQGPAAVTGEPKTSQGKEVAARSPAQNGS